MLSTHILDLVDGWFKKNEDLEKANKLKLDLELFFGPSLQTCVAVSLFGHPQSNGVGEETLSLRVPCPPRSVAMIQENEKWFAK